MEYVGFLSDFGDGGMMMMIVKGNRWIGGVL
jgi:hypothetical protein